MGSPLPIPDGSTPLDYVQEGWRHLRAQRPIAAWASWQQALRLAPDDEAATRALAALRDADELPAVARAPRRLRSPAGEDRRRRWDAAIAAADSALHDPASAAALFDRLVRDDPDDGDAWSNLALCRAWQGENVEAIEALDRFVALAAETAFDEAADAWTFAELLRHGGGAEHLADAVTSSFDVRWDDDPDRALEWLRTSPNVVEQPAPRDPSTGEPIAGGVRILEWLDQPMPVAEDVRELDDVPRLRAVVIVERGRLRFSSPDGAALRDLDSSMSDVLAGDILDRRSSPLPLPLLDQAVALVRLPPGLARERRDGLMRAAVEDYFENRWVRRERRGLTVRGISRSPIAMEATAVGRAKLEGIVRFQEQMAERPASRPLYQGYPFDCLRHALGLPLMDAKAPELPSEPLP